MDMTIEAPIAKPERPVTLELTQEQLALVEAGVKLLLVIEDDRETIHQLKDLIDRVRAASATGR